jgi:hypothetical protein
MRRRVEKTHLRDTSSNDPANGEDRTRRELANGLRVAGSQRKVSPRRVEVILDEEVVFAASGDEIRCRVED